MTQAEDVAAKIIAQINSEEGTVTLSAYEGALAASALRRPREADGGEGLAEHVLPNGGYAKDGTRNDWWPCGCRRSTVWKRCEEHKEGGPLVASPAPALDVEAIMRLVDAYAKAVGDGAAEDEIGHTAAAARHQESAADWRFRILKALGWDT